MALFVGDHVMSILSNSEIRRGVASSASMDPRDTDPSFIAWSNGTYETTSSQEIVNNPKKLRIFDRPYMTIGDEILDKKSKIQGKVQKLLKVSTAQVISGDFMGFVYPSVPSELLSRHLVVQPNDKVFLDGWVGYVKRITLEVVYKIDGVDNTASIRHACYPPREGYWPTPIYKGKIIHSLATLFLWNAVWKNGYWFMNLWRYYGKKAIINDFKIQTIEVKWLKRSWPDKSYESPPEILTPVLFQNAQFLGTDANGIGKKGNIREMRIPDKYDPIPYSQWVRTIDDYLQNEELCTPCALGTEGISEDLVTSDHVSVYVILERNFLKVAWKNGSVKWIPSNNVERLEDKGLRCGDIVGTNYSPRIMMLRLAEGGDAAEKFMPDYGTILAVDSETLTAKVRWIACSHGENEETITFREEDNVPYGEVQRKTYFDYLRHLDKNPILTFQNEKGKLTVGVLISYDLKMTKFAIRSGKKNYYVFPHEVTHVMSDHYMDAVSNEWLPWTCYEIPIRPFLIGKIDFNQLQGDNIPQTKIGECSKPMFELVPKLEAENLFYGSTFLPRVSESEFSKAVASDWQVLQCGSDSIWIEAYQDRADILSAVIRGHMGTPYENHLFVFDIKLLADYPKSLPSMLLRNCSDELSPFIDISTGSVTLPIRPGEPNVAQALKIIRDVIMGTEPVILKHRMELTAMNGINPFDEYDFMIRKNVLNYTKRLLSNPPGRWRFFIQEHYKIFLPKLIKNAERHIHQLNLRISTNEELSDGAAVALLKLKETILKLLNDLRSFKFPLSDQ